MSFSVALFSDKDGLKECYLFLLNMETNLPSDAPKLVFPHGDLRVHFFNEVEDDGNHDE